MLSYHMTVGLSFHTLAFLDNCFQSEKGSFSQAKVRLQRT